MFVIIGASSFIGVYTATHFIENGEKVIVTGRNGRFKDYYDSLGVEYVNLDLTCPSDFERLPKTDVDGVILISGALPASENADLVDDENAAQYISVNTLGTCYALEYCRRNGIKRLINTISFADVSGAWRLDPPVDEAQARDFSFKGDHSVYVISKNAASDIMEYYNQQHGMKNAWFRLPPVYGVGPHGYLKVNGKIVKSGLQVFIDKAMAGEPIEVYGYLARDTVYVKDVAQAYYKAAKSEKTYGLYNIMSGKATTLLEQAQACADVFADEKKSEIIYRDDIVNNGKSYLFSIDKAKKDFGYSPKYTDFHDLMADYKMELERGIYSSLFADRDV
ncbi:MAG: NAD(P)-dependent oxidoreductase [Lachnospiraceae bacterium]|nr:NAD(P)-dependent oxidoreductase [Lachnospiraceae bacterium]